MEQTHELQLWHFMNIDLAAAAAAAAVQEVMENDIIQNMLSGEHLQLVGC